MVSLVLLTTRDVAEERLQDVDIFIGSTLCASGVHVGRAAVAMIPRSGTGSEITVRHRSAWGPSHPLRLSRLRDRGAMCLLRSRSMRPVHGRLRMVSVPGGWLCGAFERLLKQIIEADPPEKVDVSYCKVLP